MPHLVEMRREYAEQGLVVVGVTQVDRAAAETFQVRHGATYPILSGADASFDAWGVRRLPEVFLRDPGGRIAAQGLGFVDEHLRQRLGP